MSRISKATLVVLCSVTVLELGCGYGRRAEYPDRLKSADGVLYLQMRNDESSILGLAASSDRAATTLYASTDQGRSWRRLGADWGDFLFVNSSRAYLTRGATLYETNDGEADRARPVRDFPEPIVSLSMVDSSLMVLTYRSLFATADGGRTWDEVQYTSSLGLNGPVAVAGGDGRIAVATRRGRVWLRGPGEDWREWIVGPVFDLAYSKGVFYALTQMATVAVLDGQSVEHRRLEPRDWWGAKFTKFGDRLFFRAPDGLREVVDRDTVLLTRFGEFEPSSGFMAMVGENQALKVHWEGNRVHFAAIELDSGRTEELVGIAQRP